MKFRINAQDTSLGRTATEVAKVLLGKNDPNFAANIVTKNTVVVENIEKSKIDVRKMTNLKHYTHSGYLGALKSSSYKEMFEQDPRKMFILILKRMLPDNRIRGERLKRVKFD